MLSLFKRHTNTPQPELSKMLSEFNRSLMLIADKSLLINNFISKIRQICPVEIIHLFLLDENTGKYKPQDSPLSSSLSFNGKDKLISWLFVNERSLLLSQNPDIADYFTAEEREKLEQLQAELIYPLKVMNKVSGVIMLGRRQIAPVYLRMSWGFSPSCSTKRHSPSNMPPFMRSNPNESRRCTGPTGSPL